VLVLTQAACDPGGSPRDQAGAHPTSVNPQPNPTSTNPRANPTEERGCAALPSLRTQLAQLLLVGFSGTRPGAVSRRLVDRGVGGLLLFRGNVVSAGQVRALVADLKGRAEIPLEVAVDQEPGTRVARLAGIVRATPSARQLGRLPADRVERYGQAMGRDLAALGITADLAPVLDVTGARWDGIIGDRSFGADRRPPAGPPWPSCAACPPARSRRRQALPRPRRHHRRLPPPAAGRRGQHGPPERPRPGAVQGRHPLRP
jgi:beta-N-acetylhexosaminidase